MLVLLDFEEPKAISEFTLYMFRLRKIDHGQSLGSFGDTLMSLLIESNETNFNGDFVLKLF